MRKPSHPNLSRVIPIGVSIAAIDQLTAWWARQSVPLGHETWLVRPVLGMELLFNRGATLGIGSQWPFFVTIVGVLGTIILFWLALTLKSLQIPLAVMAGGALGNVVSRIHSGRVTDFIRISGWPGIFNLADVAIRLGGLWLIIHVLITSRNKKTSSP